MNRVGTLQVSGMVGASATVIVTFNAVDGTACNTSISVCTVAVGINLGLRQKRSDGYAAAGGDDRAG